MDLVFQISLSSALLFCVSREYQSETTICGARKRFYLENYQNNSEIRRYPRKQNKKKTKKKTKEEKTSFRVQMMNCSGWPDNQDFQFSQLDQKIDVPTHLSKGF